MKKNLLTLFFSFLLILAHADLILAQSSAPTRLFRFYEDNDFLNIRGLGTDKAYTNGVRLDLFYERKKPSRFLPDHIMPKAGNGSIDTYGWSVMQMMVTPNNLSVPEYQSNDYPYSGVIFVTHSLASYNKTKKYNFQTEILAGVRGPGSFARQTQEWIHRIINDEKPLGWQNQCETKILLNINFTAEKQLFAIRNFLEIIGGSEISGGTLSNALTVYPMLRIGKMSPYFNGFFSQYSTASAEGRRKKMQFYFFAKPILTLQATNALTHGEIQKVIRTSEDTAPPHCPGIKHAVAQMDFGAVITTGNFSFAYTQKPSTAYNKGLYSHNVGNVSLYISW